MRTNRWARPVAGALVLLSVAAWGGPGGPAPETAAPRPASADGERAAGPDGSPVSTDRLEELYRDRDYFRLREALDERAGGGGPRFHFLRAAVLHAFNDPAGSNEAVGRILEGRDSISDSLAVRALRLRYHNHLRLHRYADAQEAGEAILAEDAAPARMRTDVENELRALRPIREVEPQEVVRRGTTRLEPRAGRVPVTVEGKERRYGLDTGANFSVLMRSEARALELRIREAGVEVGTATDVRVRADIAVARRLGLGGFELRRVVFLVLPDAALTFEGGFQVRGLLGFPVLEALGELRFHADGTVEVGKDGREGGPSNLALEQLTPLVRVDFEGEALICRLDTGAGRTAFYEPFLRAHRTFVEESGEPRTVRAVGAGGVREMPAFRVPSLRLRVGDRSVTLNGVDVYRKPVVEEEANYLDCNLGRDLLEGGGGYVLDFRSMSLTLR